jgi:hypothetical protein
VEYNARPVRGRCRSTPIHRLRRSARKVGSSVCLSDTRLVSSSPHLGSQPWSPGVWLYLSRYRSATLDHNVAYWRRWRCSGLRNRCEGVH